MSTDKTYCVSKSCPKADKCDRWWMNNFLDTCQRLNDVSMFDPYKKGKRCGYYIDRCKK